MKQKSAPSKFAGQDAFEELVKNHVAHILCCGNLSHYYLRTLDSHKMSSSFTIIPDAQYLEFRLKYSINYAKDEIESGDYDDLIRTLCHEVTHIPIGEIDIIPKLRKMNEVIDPLFERMTEHTSRWLYCLYLQYMKKNGIDIKTGVAKKKLK